MSLLPPASPGSTFPMATATQLIASARELLGVGTSESAGSDAAMLVWLNMDYSRLRARVAKLLPDRYTSVVTFDVVAPANTYTIVATDFETPRKVGRRSGAGSPYLPLPLLPYASAEQPVSLGWRQRGTALEFFPLLSAPNTAGADNYQLSYLTKAGALLGATEIDLPVGVERALEMRLVARGRIRLGDSASASEAYAIAQAFEREDLASLSPQYPGTPDTSADMTGMY